MTSVGHSEPAYHPFEDGLNQSGIANTAAGSIASGYYSDASALNQLNGNDQTSSDGEGRRDKARDATNQSNEGANAAAATGSALISTGLALIVPAPITAAILIGMGAAELAQAGADRTARAANSAQTNLLSHDEGNRGSTLSGQNGFTLPLDLQDSLRNRGINPDDFARKASSGELNDPNSALNALGFPSIDFTPDQFASAQTEAKGIFDNIAQEKIASLKTDRGLNFNEGRSDASLGSNLPSGKSSTSDNSFSDASSGSLSTFHGAHRGITSLTSDSNGISGAEAKGFSSPFLNQLAQEDPGRFALLQDKLLELGVKVSKSGQNIFQMARSKYHHFGKWRHDGGPMALSK